MKTQRVILYITIYIIYYITIEALVHFRSCFRKLKPGRLNTFKYVACKVLVSVLFTPCHICNALQTFYRNAFIFLTDLFFHFVLFCFVDLVSGLLWHHIFVTLNLAHSTTYVAPPQKDQI